MSAGKWALESLPAFAFALALGNLLAIGVHVFSWWLRKRARLFMAIVGALALVLFLWGAGVLCWWEASDAFNWDRVEPLPPNWQFQAEISFLKIALITFAIVGFIGAVQMRQIPARWFVACFCFCFELAFSILPLFLMIWIISEMRLPLSFGWSQKSVYGWTFVLSLFTLALLRPLVLKLYESARANLLSAR